MERAPHPWNDGFEWTDLAGPLGFVSVQTGRRLRRARLLRRGGRVRRTDAGTARRGARGRRRAGEAVSGVDARWPVQRRGTRHADGRAARGDAVGVRETVLREPGAYVARARRHRSR